MSITAEFDCHALVDVGGRQGVDVVAGCRRQQAAIVAGPCIKGIGRVHDLRIGRCIAGDVFGCPNWIGAGEDGRAQQMFAIGRENLDVVIRAKRIQIQGHILETLGDVTHRSQAGVEILVRCVQHQVDGLCVADGGRVRHWNSLGRCQGGSVENLDVSADAVNFCIERLKLEVECRPV